MQETAVVSRPAGNGGVENQVPKLSSRLLLAVPVAAYLSLAFGYALRVSPWDDEGLFAAMAFNVLRHGGRAAGPAARYFWFQRWMPPLGVVVQAGWCEVFGFSLLSARALSVAWGLVALASWFWIIEALSKNRYLALLTMCFLATGWPFVMTAATGRPDMMSAALGFAALASYLRLRERNLFVAILTGEALVAASGLTHPVGGVLAFGALLFLSVYLDWRRIRMRHVMVAALPFIVGALGWGFYVKGNPLRLMAMLTDPARTGLVISPWLSLRREITERYLPNFGLASYSSGLARIGLLILVAYAAGVIGSVCSRGIRQHRGFRTVLFLAGVYVVGLMIFDSTKKHHYLVYCTTPLCVVWSMWIYWLWVKRLVPRVFIVIAAFGLVFVQVGRLLHTMISVDSYRKTYLPAVTFLKNNVPAGGLVMGSIELGFDLGFDTGLSDDPSLGYFTGKKPDLVVVTTPSSKPAFADSRFPGLAWSLHDPITCTRFGRVRWQVYDHVTALLQSYRRVYEGRGYEIYARPQVEPGRVPP